MNKKISEKIMEDMSIIDNRIRQLLKEGHKIDAIKYLRSQMGKNYGLAEAKDYVDMIERKLKNDR